MTEPRFTYEELGFIMTIVFFGGLFMGAALVLGCQWLRARWDDKEDASERRRMGLDQPDDDLFPPA